MKLKDLPFIFGLLLLFGGGGYAVYNMTRGLRNNNPGNIRRDDQDGSGTNWLGLAPTQTDADFWTFANPVMGIRAMNHILNSYATDGIDTIAAIITRWAPPSENDTGAYITAVSNAVGLHPRDVIFTASDRRNLLKAIVSHENGVNPYADSVFDQAIAMS